MLPICSTAVIHHAPILRDMSVPGFRRSFLLRQGLLSARDGALACCGSSAKPTTSSSTASPGVSSVVKLPWMAALMSVEW